MRKIVAGLLVYLLLVLSPVAANPGLSMFSWNTPASAPSGFTPSWQAVNIGGGGLMNNVFVAPSDGTMVWSANTYGAYIYRTTGTCPGVDNGGWGSDHAAPCSEQLFTQTSANLTLNQIHNLLQGVLEITVCNSNTNVSYAFYNEQLWVTTNLKAVSSSRLWAPTPLTTTVTGNQGISAGTHSVIICDPNNPNIVYGSTPSGVSVSATGMSGGSASFSLVSGLGTVGTVPDVMAYDGSSSATTSPCTQFTGSPTCTNHFLVFVDGTGVYETYTGGRSFTLTSSGPITAQHQCQGGYCFTLKADQFGNFWAAIGDSHLYKYTPNGTAGGGTWSTTTPLVNNSLVGEFALDPTSSTSGTLRIAASYADGNISVSQNGGSSWCTWSAQPFTSSGAQPPWLGNANQDQSSSAYFSAQDFAFDTSGNLRLGAGVGIWKIASASVGCGATWTSDNVGIENLVTSHVDGPPGSSVIIATWDRAFWTVMNPDVFPSHYWMDFSYNTVGTGGVEGGWALDCTPMNVTGTACAGWAGDNGNYGASTTNGSNWTIWGSFSPASTNVGGEVAVSTSTNWLWIPANTNGQLYFTTNGATSAWTASTTTGMTGPLSANQQHGWHISADRVTANTFCLIDDVGKIWASTNSGSTWSNNSGLTIASTVKYNDALKSVWGQAGVYYYSMGNAGGSSTTLNLYKITKTTNECDTATVVNANITNIYGMGYGAPIPGGTFPTIYFYGAVSGVQGVYEIDNGGTTATLISAPSAAQTWPNNSSDFINDVSGDMNFYGTVYVGFNGSGLAYIQHQNACPAVEWTSAFLPNVSLTGTVNLQVNSFGKVPVTSVSFYVDGTLIGTQTTPSGTTYTQSWVTGGVATGAHTLQAAVTGNGCNPTASTNYANISIPITTH